LSQGSLNFGIRVWSNGFGPMTSTQTALSGSTLWLATSWFQAIHVDINDAFANTYDPEYETAKLLGLIGTDACVPTYYKDVAARLAAEPLVVNPHHQWDLRAN
jgi:hypothetical protein